MDNSIEYLGVDQRTSPGTKRLSVARSERDVWDSEETEIVEATLHEQKEKQGIGDGEILGFAPPRDKKIGGQVAEVSCKKKTAPLNMFSEAGIFELDHVLSATFYRTRSCCAGEWEMGSKNA